MSLVHRSPRVPCVLALALALLVACNNTAKTGATVKPTGHLTTTTHTPTPKPSGKGNTKGTGTGGDGGDGGDGTGSDDPGGSHTVKITPDPDGPEIPDVSPQPGQLVFLPGHGHAGFWDRGPSLIRPRVGLSAGALGRSIIVAEGEHRPSLEVYNPEVSTTWTLDTNHDQDFHVGEGETLKEGIYFSAYATLGEELWTSGGVAGSVGAAGEGGRVEMYLYRRGVGFSLRRNPDEGTHTLETGVIAATAGVLKQTFVAAGGYRGLDKTLNLTQRVSLDNFDDASTGATMPQGVAGASSVVLNDQLVVMGGYTLANGTPTPVQSVQIYDLAGNSWKRGSDAGAPVPDLPVALHSGSAALLSNKIYFAGGMGADGKVSAAVYMFDPAKASAGWQRQTDLPTPRALLAMVGFQGALWAMGGIGDDNQPLSTVETYVVEALAP